MASDTNSIMLAEEAADRLFDARNGDARPLMSRLTSAKCRPGQRRLSNDKLQGISEIVQNADDVEASQVIGYSVAKHQR